MTEKIPIIVDGRPAEAKEGAMLLAALQELGLEVPTLCHHPHLEPVGACRLCMVEDEKSLPHVEVQSKEIGVEI